MQKYSWVLDVISLVVDIINIVVSIQPMIQ